MTTKYLAREIARTEKSLAVLAARIERLTTESQERLAARVGSDQAAAAAIQRHLDELLALRDGGGR